MSADISVIKKYYGTQQKKVNGFLLQFVNNIASSSTEYCKQSLKIWDYMDYNLLATERGVYSLLSASVNAITPIHNSEMGVTRRRDHRRRGNQDQRKTETEPVGRVDLWCYKDGIEFFFEFKRTYISPDNIIKPSVPGKIKGAWEELTNQVNDVKRGVGKDPSTVFIGMHIVTLRLSRRSRDQSKIKDALDDAECITRKKIRAWSELFPRSPRSIDSIIEWKIGRNDHKFRAIESDNEDPIRWVAFPRHLFCFKIE